MDTFGKFQVRERAEYANDHVQQTMDAALRAP